MKNEKKEVVNNEKKAEKNVEKKNEKKDTPEPLRSQGERKELTVHEVIENALGSILQDQTRLDAVLEEYLEREPHMRILLTMETLTNIISSPITFKEFLTTIANTHIDILKKLPLPNSANAPIRLVGTRRTGQKTRESKFNEKELSDIETLTSLGYSRVNAVQAYIACDKNVNSAANLLLTEGAIQPARSESNKKNDSDDEESDGEEKEVEISSDLEEVD